ncbi:hypothetical protein AN219_12120 [Streptomyces nanshensis]|nr:hypothetical protein AN219_12120 [Streptomyces nanshensis]
MAVQGAQSFGDLLFGHVGLDCRVSDQNGSARPTSLKTEFFPDAESMLIQADEVVDGLAHSVVHLGCGYPGTPVPLDKWTTQTHGTLQLNDVQRPVSSYERKIDLVP